MHQVIDGSAETASAMEAILARRQKVGIRFLDRGDYTRWYELAAGAIPGDWVVSVGGPSGSILVDLVPPADVPAGEIEARGDDIVAAMWHFRILAEGLAKRLATAGGMTLRELSDPCCATVYCERAGLEAYGVLDRHWTYFFHGMEVGFQCESGLTLDVDLGYPAEFGVGKFDEFLAGRASTAEISSVLGRDTEAMDSFARMAEIHGRVLEFLTGAVVSPTSSIWRANGQAMHRLRRAQWVLHGQGRLDRVARAFDDGSLFNRPFVATSRLGRGVARSADPPPPPRTSSWWSEVREPPSTQCGQEEILARADDVVTVMRNFRALSRALCARLAGAGDDATPHDVFHAIVCRFQGRKRINSIWSCDVDTSAIYFESRGGLLVKVYLGFWNEFGVGDILSFLKWEPRLPEVAGILRNDLDALCSFGRAHEVHGRVDRLLRGRQDRWIRVCECLLSIGKIVRIEGQDTKSGLVPAPGPDAQPGARVAVVPAPVPDSPDRPESVNE